jgi:hypothetical protein
VTIGGNLTVNGNLFINGNLTTINSNNLTVNDSMIYLAEENPADTLDIGITAHVVNPTLNHVGFVRDATDSTWKLFSNVATQPTNTVNFTGANYANLLVGNIQATYFTGNGAFLTGLYSNVNAATFLASGTLNTDINTNGNLTIYNNDGNIYIGDINTGTVNSDVGILFDGRQSIKSSVFTEVNGNILSYAINMAQITSNISAIAGGIFRLDVRDASRKFVVVRRAAGATVEEETFDISLDTGLGRFTSNLQVGRTATNYSNLTVSHSTPSTSTTTGALQVQGGAGIIGNLHVGGNVNATYFVGMSTSAQYADLAENYIADFKYAPGTIVEFGGAYEITQCNTDMSSAVAGVVSENPAYLMNSNQQGTHVVAVALQGRVKTQVIGPIRKGNMLVSAGNGLARAELRPEMGTVLGKALEDFNDTQGIIEIVVGVR